MKRALAAMFSVAMVLSMIAPAAATGSAVQDNRMTPAAQEIGGIVGYSVPDHVVTAGVEGDPMLYVEYDNGSFDSLDSWLDSSDERRLITNDADDNRALIAIPVSDLGTSTVHRLLGVGLYSRTYVESIDVNQEVNLIEPVDNLIDPNDYETPRGAFLARAFGGSFDQAGVAYDKHANLSTISDARNSTNVSDVTADGTGITVAIIDTGINTDNGTVFGNGSADSGIERVVNAKNTITDEEGIDNVTDGNGHGTWVASAIAANASNVSHDGVAPNATIIPIKALNEDGSGDVQDIVEGVEWAGDNDADVISMSLGSVLYSETLADEIRSFLNEGGSAVVVAVGNSRQTTRWIASPADVSSVISVAASNTTDPKHAGTAYFSNVGPDNGLDGSNAQTRGVIPNVTAPGMKLEAATVTENGRQTTETLTGTSMATPIVAGAIVLALDEDSSLVGKPARVRGFVENTSRPMPGAGVTEAGSGMLDANALVNQEETPGTQEDRASTDAQGRDAANRALSGSVFRLAAQTRRTIGL